MLTRRSRLNRLIVPFLVAVLAISWLPAPARDSLSAGSPSVVLTGRRVLVLGDSITQDGRYVTFIEYYLRRLSPAEKSDLISIGLSSETVSGLSEKTHPFPRPCILERVDRALKAVKPQVVFACYGMNDGIYHPASPERLAAFTTGVHELIARVRVTGAQLILFTPTVFDPLPIHDRTVPADAGEFGYAKPFVGYDSVLAEYARAELALNEPGVTVIDLHGPLTTALLAQRSRTPAFSFSPDGVHPNDTAHLLMARIILETLGYSLKGESADAVSIEKDPLFPLIRDRRELRSEAWLPFVGYVRGETFKSASVTASEQVATLLQEEIYAHPAN
jgi:lysophospholipase L1-like esterase